VFFPAYSCLSSQFYGNYQKEIRKGPVRLRPNIILIVMDTVRADHLKSYGYQRDTMPALERWAKGALVAKRAITPSGWTTPAHASIFSGRTVSRHGIHCSPKSLSTTRSFEDILWLPERLAAEGYYCLAVSANPLAIPPDAVGFHRVLIPRRHDWYDSSLGALFDHISPLTKNISEWMRWRMPYVDAKGIVDIAMRAVPDDDRPLFLFVNFLDAHSPYNPPAFALKLLGIQAAHLFGRYQRSRPLTRRWGLLPEGKLQNLADLYDGEMRWLDLHLEKFLRWIDERYGENTIVIITSDHGEELGEKGRIGHYYGLSQNLIHVPLYMRSPGLEPGELEEVVSIRNLYDLICLSAKGGTSNIESLVQTDDDGLISERYPSYSNLRVFGREHYRPWVSMIKGKYKAVGPSDYGFEFYDVETSGFDREVAALNPSLEKSLRARLDEYWIESRDTREEISQSPSEEEIEALRAIGYVQ
jgi:hypothetical protein